MSRFRSRARWIRGVACILVSLLALAGPTKAEDPSDASRPAVLPIDGSIDPVVGGDGPAPIFSLAVSPAAPLIALGCSQQIFLYHLDSSELLSVLPFPAGRVGVLRFDASGVRLLAAGGDDEGAVQVWEVASSRSIFDLSSDDGPIRAADLDGEQGRVAVGSGELLNLYDLTTHAPQLTLRGHAQPVTAIAFGPDGRRLASADLGGGLRLWRADSGELISEIRPTSDRPAADPVVEIRWHPDGSRLVTVDRDGAASIWPLDGDATASRWPVTSDEATSIDVDDRGMVSADSRGVVRVWSSTGAETAKVEDPLDGRALARFDATGAAIVAGDAHGQVRVWSRADGKLRSSFLAEPPRVLEALGAIRNRVASEEQEVAAATDRNQAAHEILSTAVADFEASDERHQLSVASHQLASERALRANQLVVSIEDAIRAAESIAT
ncbi:MAG: hypothetical protein KDC38_18165, partial [Planctomycetes bacterium]|nr:hypothetical protein [Planctomycetota bacterium]